MRGFACGNFYHVTAVLCDWKHVFEKKKGRLLSLSLLYNDYPPLAWKPPNGSPPALLGSTPACPNWSYRPRFSSSLNTSYAWGSKRKGDKPKRRAKTRKKKLIHVFFFCRQLHIWFFVVRHENLFHCSICGCFYIYPHIISIFIWRFQRVPVPSCAMASLTFMPYRQVPILFGCQQQL